MMKTDTNPSEPSEIVRGRCSAYLLGEMSTRQMAEFESDLDDPVLSAALLRESELLCSIAMSDSLAFDSPELATYDPVHATRPGDRHAHDISVRSFAIAFATLAATLLLFATYRFTNRSKSNSATMQASASPLANSFELEIAKTWVDPAIDWDFDDQDDFRITDNDDFIGQIDDADSDDTFEWMVAAVEASIRQGDNSNDG